MQAARLRLRPIVMTAFFQFRGHTADDRLGGPVYPAEGETSGTFV
jgi:hypothetical protein